MTVVEFFQIVGAVIAGNLLTLLYVYYLWRGRRAEMQGLDPDTSLPLHVYVCAVIPLGVCGWALYSLV